jgi:hypothetical protein
MRDLYQTVVNRYVEFMSTEYRGTHFHYQQERQLHLLVRRITRWYINHS